VQKPLVPVAKPVLAPPKPASTALSPSAPAPLPTGEEWVEQALGKMGLLHPGAWIAPSLVMMFGSPGLVALGMVIFPIALIMALMRLGETNSEPRYPATFAVPAAVLLLLMLWVSSAMGAAGPGADAPVDVPQVETGPLPPTPDVTTRQLRLGQPEAHGNPRLLELVNGLDMERDIGGAYTGVPDEEEERVRLSVYVLADGTVDPVRVRTEEATDWALANSAEAKAGEMRFVFLDADGAPAEGWVRIDVTYGP
jgi:hypothetical protein